MPIEIFVVTEGRTEREVGRVLHKHGLLQRALPKPPGWRSPLGPREGYEQVVEMLAKDSAILQPGRRIMLIFDQENAPSEQARANQIAQDLQSKQDPNNPIWNGLSWVSLSPTLSNLFKAHHRDSCIVLHISNASGPGIQNKDFDGYILQLIQSSNAASFVQGIIPSYMNLNAQDLIQKAYNEFTQIMQNNGFPWQKNKAWLYAYITAFQFRNSHVWFAKRVVEQAIRQNQGLVQQVFAPLIFAWDWLVERGDTCQ